MQLLVQRTIIAIYLCLTFCSQNANAFTTSRGSISPFGVNMNKVVEVSRRATHFTSSSSVLLATDTDETMRLQTVESPSGDTNDYHHNAVVRAPLKFIGPYPCLGLKFPKLATLSQRQRNNVTLTGVSMDFVLDTAANTNTIHGQVAKELNLTVVGMALPGVGAGGAMQGGATFLLGDAQLEGLSANNNKNDDTRNDKEKEEEKEDEFTFMTGLTASALPVASPAAAGLLSMAFFNCFPGGVEFDWGTATIVSPDNKEDVEVTKRMPPSVTFHGQDNNVLILNMMKKMARVPITELPTTRLPTVNIKVNGITMPALLDTGSPITVLNAQAAKLAGIETVSSSTTKPSSDKKNPLSAFADRFKEAQAAAQAAARGDVLTLATSNGGPPVQLWKSMKKVDIGLVGSTADVVVVDFASSNIYVGDLPGLAALNGLGDSSPPAAVLGMDVLRTRPKMLLRAQNQEVYF